MAWCGTSLDEHGVSNEICEFVQFATDYVVVLPNSLIINTIMLDINLIIVVIITNIILPRPVHFKSSEPSSTSTSSSSSLRIVRTIFIVFILLNVYNDIVALSSSRPDYIFLFFTLIPRHRSLCASGGQIHLVYWPSILDKNRLSEPIICIHGSITRILTSGLLNSWFG